MGVSGLYLTKPGIGRQQQWVVKGGGNNQLVQDGNCLAIQGDLDAIGSLAIKAPCDPKQKGQIWSFIVIETIK